MKKTRILALGCALIMAASALAGCGAKPAAPAEPAVSASEPEVSATDFVELPDPDVIEIPEFEGYELLWHDEFSGEKLDDEIWNKQVRQPGYTNQELQAYTISENNIFLRNGKLVLKAIKSDRFGSDYYTSGKVTTSYKRDFTYGKVVVSAKVPEGQGLWPAIWMMPTKENIYGQWPKCGEIDIMEILGHQTDTAYTTIHYGNPHAEQQGKLKLENGSFSDGFHEYCVEWEPGEMRFYVDGVNTLVANDWFTAIEGEDEKPFPAPFDQDFYLQLNLAVGGTWPGNPDETTDFDKAEFVVDYVRVYQKPEYDTNVTRPEKEFREAGEDGNYLVNGDFAQTEALDDGDGWAFMLFNGGKGAAEIKDSTLTITTEAEGTVDYSLQLVQPNIPMIKGQKYKVSFEAASSDTRDFIVCISGPSAAYVRYMADTKVTVTPEWQTFTYEFEMTERDDENGRIEFNMGKTGSTADIYLRNVRVEKIDG